MFFKQKNNNLVQVELTRYQLDIQHLIDGKPWGTKYTLDKCPIIEYDHKNDNLDWYIENELEQGYVKNVVSYSLLKI